MDARATKKPQIPYQPAPEVSLAEVTEQMTLELAVSPDAGWVALAAFLAGTTRESVVVMTAVCRRRWETIV